MAIAHSSHWQVIAKQYFPEEQLDFAADVYQQLAREAAGLCLQVGVDIASGVTGESVDAVFDLAKATEAARHDALAAAAYTVGYRAQLDDAMSNNYHKLDGLVAILDENRKTEETVTE